MRDFYPEDMRLQNWLFDAWRRVSRSFGFSEYEGPIFEFLDLYTLKSGEGIVGELFSFSDRGERQFAIRPEMTPTLARMVAARANALPRPIKWFSIPRMCRAEKPQRGRLREFFQWNVDVLGVDDPLADAETIAVVVEFFRQVGLTERDVAVGVSSRPLAHAVLAAIGVPAEEMAAAFALIDRFDKLPREEFGKQWDARFSGAARGVPAATIVAQLENPSLDACLELAGHAGDTGLAAREQFERLWAVLGELGARSYCEFDLKVVRGIAYYTGPVFEARMRAGGLRALCGGGRYDNLCEMLDGPRISGVGFGMGDAPVLEALRELGRLPAPREALDVFVIDAGLEYYDKALEVVGGLRRAGLSVDFSYKRQPLGKQLKQAATREARYAVIVGAELAAHNQLTLKDMSEGVQKPVDATRFLHDPRTLLR
jgi:histidyl-tRNA synthetase